MAYDDNSTFRRSVDGCGNTSVDNHSDSLDYNGILSDLLYQSDRQTDRTTSPMLPLSTTSTQQARLTSNSNQSTATTSNTNSTSPMLMTNSDRTSSNTRSLHRKTTYYPPSTNNHFPRYTDRRYPTAPSRHRIANLSTYSQHVGCTNYNVDNRARNNISHHDNQAINSKTDHKNANGSGTHHLSNGQSSPFVVNQVNPHIHNQTYSRSYLSSNTSNIEMASSNLPTSQASLWSPAREISANLMNNSENLDHAHVGDNSIMDPVATFNNPLLMSTMGNFTSSINAFNDSFPRMRSSYCNSSPSHQSQRRYSRESTTSRTRGNMKSPTTSPNFNPNFQSSHFSHPSQDRSLASNSASSSGNLSAVSNMPTFDTFSTSTISHPRVKPTLDVASESHSLDVLCDVASEFYNEQNDDLFNLPIPSTSSNYECGTNVERCKIHSNGRNAEYNADRQMEPSPKRIRRSNNLSTSSNASASTASNNHQRSVAVIVLDDDGSDDEARNNNNNTNPMANIPTVIDLCESPPSQHHRQEEEIEVISLPTLPSSPPVPLQHTTTTTVENPDIFSDDADDEDVVFTGRVNSTISDHFLRRFLLNSDDNSTVSDVPSSSSNSEVNSGNSFGWTQSESSRMPATSPLNLGNPPSFTPPYVSHIFRILPLGIPSPFRITVGLDAPHFNNNNRRGGLEKRSIDNLSSRRFDGKADNDATSDTTCAICMDDYKKREKIRELPCSHGFHARCVDKWLRQHNSCPICRENINPTV